MLSEHHDLAHELPEYKELIHDLKMNNAHFSKLFDEYEEVNKKVLRSEKEVEVLCDEELEDLKKKRLLLKDEMVEMLSKAA
jgi:uncharacterized protein YdcH (DUF465 family)